MALFGFGKKKNAQNKNPSCCCGSAPNPAAKAAAASHGTVKDRCCANGERGIQSIKVLGSGCKRCHELNAETIAAVKELGLGVEVEYITDMEKIVSYGVMSMPAIVVNETVVSMGKVLKSADVIKLLKQLGYC